MTLPSNQMTYRAALRRFDNRGDLADDSARMAGFCRDSLEMSVGSVDPERVWTGAQRRGLLTEHLRQLATKNSRAVLELQWVR